MFFNTNTLLNHPRKIFLIDGTGACLSALFLLLLLWSNLSGMPERELFFLACTAGVFAVYSFCYYLFVRDKWRRYLKNIILANVLYCLVTIGLVVYYYEMLTPIGIAYFLGEVVVIGVLVRFEAKVLINGANNVKE